MKNGWPYKRIGEVCEVVNGGTPKTAVTEYWNGEHLWITPAEMGRRESPYVDNTERKLTDAGLRDSSARMLPPYSVILSSRAPIGHLVINVNPMSTNQGCKSLIPSDQLDYKFLYYYLGNNVKLLESLGSGATFKELSGSKLKDVYIPIPPLSEQQRVVRMLDEAFTGLAIAQVNAEKNLQNARALFESHLQSVFTSRGKDWVETTLGDACVQITDGKHGDCVDALASGYYFLSAKDIKGGTLSYQGARQITKADFEETHRRTNLEPGDILITNSGTIGRMAIAPQDSKTSKTTFQKSVAILKPKREILDSRFAYHCLSTALSRFVTMSAGAAQKNLLLRDLRGYRFPLPESIKNQKVVAASLDALAAKTQRLTQLYNQKLAALSELKKSLLHQAFSGEL